MTAHFGGVDLLINNAGQGFVAHFDQTPREARLHEAELKLFGVINPVQAFYRRWNDRTSRLSLA